MRYVMKQKILSLTDSFIIKSSDDSRNFKIKGRLISLGDRLTLSNMEDEEQIKIKQVIINLVPSYRIYRNNQQLAKINKKLFTVFKDKFRVKMKDGSPDLEITGNIFDHEYKISRKNQTIAKISKRWVSIRDSYGIDIDEEEDQAFILSCAVIIDMISHNTDNDSSTDTTD